MTNVEIITRLGSGEPFSFYGTMFGFEYPNDEIIEISSKDVIISLRHEAMLFIWGWPGPDRNVYRVSDYGKTWAFTREEFIRAVVE